ncbi:hypothetical protein B0H11DRAFT_2231859 [Mycena galericulata]|nr:hypothetical protein B0H11DRAFT_2231859 [Mycena galericulata]
MTNTNGSGTNGGLITALTLPALPVPAPSTRFARKLTAACANAEFRIAYLIRQRVVCQELGAVHLSAAHVGLLGESTVELGALMLNPCTETLTNAIAPDAFMRAAVNDETYVKSFQNRWKNCGRYTNWSLLYNFLACFHRPHRAHRYPYAICVTIQRRRAARLASEVITKVFEVPFNSTNHVVQLNKLHADGGLTSYIKGAPEHEFRAEYDEAYNYMASRGHCVTLSLHAPRRFPRVTYTLRTTSSWAERVHAGKEAYKRTWPCGVHGYEHG